MKIGAFKVEGLLGSGGMAQVYRALHEPTGLPVALKVLRPEQHSHVTWQALRNEVQAVGRLDHPNVVRLFHHGVVPADSKDLPVGSTFLAMSLADDCWRTRPILDWATLRRLLFETLSGLAHAHGRGVAHLDIKPSNLLIAEGRTLLSDFGIAAIWENAGRVVGGSRAFRAPEQVGGRHADIGPRTDLYALGRTVLALVSGCNPDHEAPRWEPTFDVPGGLLAWVARLLRRTPEERFRTAASARLALSTLGPSVPVASVASSRAATDDSTVTELEIESTSPTELCAEPAARIDPSVPVSVDLPSPRTGPRVEAGIGLLGLRRPHIVGRATEQRVLWETLVAVATTGAPGVLLLRGPAGVGKTCLANWLGEKASELGCAQVMRVRYGMGHDEPLRRAARRALRCDDLPWPEMYRRVRAVARRSELPAPLDGLLTELIRPCGALVTRDAVGGFGALLQLDSRPTLLIVDDVQHAGRDLDTLAGISVHPGLLTVCTLRDDLPGSEEVAEALAAPSLCIGPLAAAATQSLLKELVDLDAEALTSLERHTAGNPMFAVALIAAWHRDGVLEPTPTGLRLTAASPDLPGDLWAAWTQRVEALCERSGSDFAEVLELAAALGIWVAHSELLALGLEFDAIRAARVVLLDEGLARPEADGWTFVHGMLLEGVRARCGPRWKRRHLACAEMLAARDVPHRRRIGHHFLKAGRWEPAAEALLFDAADALSADALRYGDLLCTEAGHALAQFDPRQQTAGWAELLSLRALHAHNGTDLDRARELARQAVAHPACEGVAKARAYRILATVASRRGEVDDALGAMSEAMAAAEAAGSASQIACCHLDLGAILQKVARLDEAEPHLLAAIAGYEALGDGRSVALCRHSLGQLAWRRGDVDLAMARWTTTEVELADSAPGMLPIVWNELGVGARAQGDLDHSVACFARARDGFAAVGQRVGSQYTELNLAVVELMRGRAQQALEAATSLVAVAERQRRPPLVAACLAVQFAAEARLGEIAAATRCLTRLETILADTPVHQPDLDRLLRDGASDLLDHPEVAARALALATRTP